MAKRIEMVNLTMATLPFFYGVDFSTYAIEENYHSNKGECYELSKTFGAHNSWDVMTKDLFLFE